jgi:hypothetical protein
MPVRIAYADAMKPDAWRTDWPAVPASEKEPREPDRSRRVQEPT